MPQHSLYCSKYYCEVCFAVPLRQSFTYIYHPKPFIPAKPPAAKTKASKKSLRRFPKQEQGQEQAAEPVPPKSQPQTELESAAMVYPQLGQRIFASFGYGRQAKNKEGWIISASTEPPESLQQAMAAGKLQLAALKELDIADPLPLFGQPELQLARWLARYYMCSLGEALNCILPTGKKEKESRLCAEEGLRPKSSVAGLPALSKEQQAAVAAVCRSTESQRAQRFYYLFGPTGSGKTEVFLQCMAQVLRQGKSVIYLVPEISLCYQLQEQLQHRFGQAVALLHSHLSAPLRLWYWRSLQQGDRRIVLGARSAVFAPVRNLGLIILDEEHEQSYKAGDTPRYHTRQVAMRRCHDLQAILLMGSATPSVEAMHAASLPELLAEPLTTNQPQPQTSSQYQPIAGDWSSNLQIAAPTDLSPILSQNLPDYLPDFIKCGLQISPEIGQEIKRDGTTKQPPSTPSKTQTAPPPRSIELLRLSRRLAGGSFPQVEIVDLRRSKTIISDTLVREIEAVTSRGEQVILFLNRRGYSPVVECFACGKVQECHYCSVALTYHKHLGRLKCHHCGFALPLGGSCNYCRQGQLEFIGFGTEQIEEELQRYFGHLRIARLDTDVSRRKGHSQKILQCFRAGQLDLLVGTQMVAKGLNFERVKLVGVVLADTSLNMPDFRAAERSFSLLVQVAGRAGRYSEGGKVCIQTYQPQSEVVQRAAALDWPNFYAKEMQLRELTHYPPFSRLIRLVFRGGNLTKVRAEAGQWHRDLHQAIAATPRPKNSFAQVLAPCECPYLRVAGKYRYHILLRCSGAHFGALHNLVQAYFWQAKRNANVYVEVDVDPAAMI